MMPNRNSLDARIIEEVRAGTATFGNNWFIYNPDDAGGYPKLNSTEPPADSDHDGIPDD